MLSKTHFRVGPRKAHGVNLSITDEFVLNFLSGLDTPRALTVWLMYESGEHAQLVALDCDPLSYIDGFRFRDDYAATLLLRKADFLKTGIDLRQVAMKKFMESELKCQETNQRFRNLGSDPLYQGQTASVLFDASRKISFVLGRISSEELVDCSNWGPGATASLRDVDTSRPNKFWKDSGTTPQLLGFVTPWFAKAFPLWSQGINYFEVIRGNVILFVPKDSRSHRTIAKEVGINSFLQKGCGTMIRRRLKHRAGIDLNSQSDNQIAALKSSIDSSCATIDLKSASDSIATGLVRFLLQWSPDWFSLLDVLRSHEGALEGQSIRYQKFASMGNGFCFELESLIFWSIAVSCCEAVGSDPLDVRVYGDDIVIPVGAVPLLRSVLDFCGFTVNESKSFSSGYFRESCGVHYWAGVDCQPYFLKEAIDDLSRVYRVANAVKRLAFRRCGSLYCGGVDRKLFSAHAALVHRVDKRYAFRIPDGIGDGGFISDWDETSPPFRRPKDGWEGWLVRSWVVKPIERSSTHMGILFAHLKDRSVDRGWKNSYPLRGRTRNVIQTLLVVSWPSFGPWV